MTKEDSETVAQEGAKWDGMRVEALIFEGDVLALENRRLREERDAAVDARARFAAIVGRLLEEVEWLRIIEATAREYVTDSYRPERKYDAQRFDALCAALERGDE